MLKNFSVKSLLSGLKLYREIFNSFYMVLFSAPKRILSSLKLSIVHKKQLAELKKLQCPIKYMAAHYFYIDNNHLEVYPLHGVMLRITKHKKREVLKITALDDDVESLENFKLMLDNHMCATHTINADINNFDFSFGEKFNSIALNFALNKIDFSKQNIDELFGKLKTIMADGSVIFGLEKANISPNERTSLLKDLKNALDKYFDNNSIDIINSCIIFKAFIKQTPKNFEKRRPTAENTKGKHLKIHYDSLKVWLKNLDKFQK